MAFRPASIHAIQFRYERAQENEHRKPLARGRLGRQRAALTRWIPGSANPATGTPPGRGAYQPRCTGTPPCSPPRTVVHAHFRYLYIHLAQRLPVAAHVRGAVAARAGLSVGSASESTKTDGLLISADNALCQAATETKTETEGALRERMESISS